MWPEAARKWDGSHNVVGITVAKPCIWSGLPLAQSCLDLELCFISINVICTGELTILTLLNECNNQLTGGTRRACHAASLKVHTRLSISAQVEKAKGPLSLMVHAVQSVMT